MNKQLTPERVKILGALQSGPKTWSQLRLAYFGEARAQSKASTSFNNQLHRMQNKGLIQTVMGGYEITDLGKALIKEEDPIQTMAIKTRAQLRFESGCSHTIVDQYNKCTQCGVEVK
jgi:predicted transcriptional regulator